MRKDIYIWFMMFHLIALGYVAEEKTMTVSPFTFQDNSKIILLSSIDLPGISHKHSHSLVCL